ncbi:hypothetical protein [Enterobacter asburiae]
MITEKNNVFYCDCGFSFQRGRSGDHNCAEGLRIKLAESEARCAALAAENAGLKALIEQHANSVAVCPNCSHEEPSETDDIVALYRSMETPATGSFLAEVRAQGVEMLTADRRYEWMDSYIDDANEFAALLRKGVQS